tara:strand:- start:1578 stop:3035 length:1458 start_codon:yes stop_codon:yes gene_type:complete
MGGGLMQLVAYGAQDIYLTGNPQITFFKVVYRRHTNFSVESIEQTFNGTSNFGKKVSCTISRNGDLIHKMLLQLTISKTDILSTKIARWVKYLGEVIIKYVEVEIGGQKIDRHYGEWLHIWSELTLKDGVKQAYNNMIGNVPKLTKARGSTTTATIDEFNIYIPLQFWFCRNPGLALPLIALQYHEVKINIEFENLNKCLYAYGNTDAVETNFHNVGDISTATPSITSSSLWVDYIYLDTDERRRFAQLSHEYLIEQLQYPGEETLTTLNQKIKLAFNHPVKQLVWVVQKEEVQDALQAFNYTTRFDNNPFLNNDNNGSNELQAIIESINNASNNLKYMDNQKGKNNCAYALLKLNGQDRFAKRDGNYFNYVIPYYHYSNSPSTGINTYSFSLKPEEHQPSGTCNFSRIDNATLNITLESKTLQTGAISTQAPIYDTTTNLLQSKGLLAQADPTVSSGSAKIRVYAVNYNVLRIMSGMGGLAYSN